MYVVFFSLILLLQYLKIIQNPSYVELQKAANQGRRCTWEKLSAIKANCGIELALDESVAILNHMRRLKRNAERVATASHGLPSPAKLRGQRGILEEVLLLLMVFPVLSNSVVQEEFHRGTSLHERILQVP